MADNFNILDTPAAGGSGTAVQIVESSTSAFASTSTPIPADDTIPQNTEGGEFITVTITPTSLSNKLFIESQLMCRSTSSVRVIFLALFQDSTADAIAAIASDAATTDGARVSGVISTTIDVNTLSATTFKIRAGLHTTGTLEINGSGSRELGGVASSFIRVTEYTP